jgi:hypothetical protein
MLTGKNSGCYRKLWICFVTADTKVVHVLLLLLPDFLQVKPCSAGHVSACFGLFQLILSHRILLNQPKPAGFSTSRTSPKLSICTMQL